MKRSIFNRFCIGLIIAWSTTIEAADPFDTCPTKAFLFQGEPTTVYGVKIVSGSFSTLNTDMGNNAKLNGVGFSVHDYYLYGFGYGAADVVKIGKDYQKVPLNVSGLPSTSFYVGDVAVTENALYLYRKGSDYGLYRISLDSSSGNYLAAQRVINGSSLNLNIFDLAFHPSSGKAYAVDSNGNLHEINVLSGASTNLGNVGVTGTFGASYFDVDGNFYISRNSDGNVYRIKVDEIGNDGTDATFDPIVTGDTYTYSDYPNNTNTNGSSNNDLLYIADGMDGSGFNYNGNAGFDRLLLGYAQSYYTVVSQGTGAYRVTWPNGNYLNLNGVEEIVYDAGIIEADDALDFFAYGPSSGNNDGARCATAPLIDEEEDDIYDFGDAPSSYSTSLTNNGPRHEVGSLFLGVAVSTESDAKATDENDDGVAFVTGIQAATNAELQSIVSVTASQAGYLHGWVDWDRNGNFDADEKVFDGRALAAGSNTLLMSSQAGASYGTTYARFRLSDQTSLNATGGVTNGEVEDYQITVGDSQYTTVCYPSSTSYVTLAFEDKWPQTGDYDFNDVVVQYRACQDKVSTEVKRYWIKGNLVASGGMYHNAFAVRLEGVAPSSVDTSLISHTIGSEYKATSPLEAGRSEVILTVLPNTRALGKTHSSCRVFRAEAGCFSPEIIPFSLHLTLSSGIDASTAPSGVLDPFIYAVADQAHGDFVTAGNERNWEVHLKNQAPTEAFDINYYGSEKDASAPASDLYFLTSSGLPFAIQVGTEWQAPRENIDITNAYTQFADFAESNGVSNSLWFQTFDNTKVIPNN